MKNDNFVVGCINQLSSSPAPKMTRAIESKILAVYIAAPYTLGDREKNVLKAMETADILIRSGFAPFNPLLTHFQHVKFPQNYEMWMRQDFVYLQRCDCLLRIPGKSKGADREIKEAKRLGIPVFNSIEDLAEYRDNIK
jgi:nucleoside 2-deoxyribosyltransferase